MKITVVRIGSGLLGVIALLTGIRSIIGGAQSLLTDEALSSFSDPSAIAALDNEFRFFATIWLVVGLGLLRAAWKIESEGKLFLLGMVAIFIGGFGRIVGAVDIGTVATRSYVAIAIELVVPVVLLLLYKAHIDSTQNSNQLAPTADVASGARRDSN